MKFLIIQHFSFLLFIYCFTWIRFSKDVINNSL